MENPNEITCPKCGSHRYTREKCMDGVAKCGTCGFTAKHALYDNPYKTLYVDKYDENKEINEYPDYIEVIGGDGSLLKAINKFRHLNKPFYGIAGGTLNFLMNSSFKMADDAKYKTFELIKVKVKTKKWFSKDMDNVFDKDDNFVVREFQAFNDIMLGGDMNSWIDFSVHDKDRIIGSFKGGGIIISTAQGSTGINKNNGGVILPLSSNNWIFTGDKTNRNINYVIEPKRTTIKCSSRNEITLWVDGQNHIIKDVVEMEVLKGDSVQVIFNDYNSFKQKRRI